MNVCVAHLQMNACVAKNFGAWTEKVGHPCPTFMAHPTRVGRRVGALHKKLGHPWLRLYMVHVHYNELDAIYAFNFQPSQCLYYVIIRIIKHMSHQAHYSETAIS